MLSIYFYEWEKVHESPFLTEESRTVDDLLDSLPQSNCFGPSRARECIHQVRCSSHVLW